MGKATGFLEYEREVSREVPPRERILNFEEFHIPLSLEKQKLQGARCMECGVPFCQYGESIRGMTSGCPLHNLIPEWNDLVYHGNFEQAYYRLHKTSNFPEFTCRVCPALCEKACTCGLNDEPVSVKENERAIIEYAYENGLADAKPPRTRTGKTVAVVGSGPAGLAVADELNRRGHSVTVFERNDRVGGLLRYGIPNMKLEKWVVDRKINIMQDEGVVFETGVNIGFENDGWSAVSVQETTGIKKAGTKSAGLADNKDLSATVTDKKSISADSLLADFDAVVLTTGTPNPRDIAATGREAKGIYFAVDFLTRATKALLYDGSLRPDEIVSAKGKNVIVIGGGDTGNDCVGTCIRHGCKSVTQLEMMPKPPEERTATNQWPEWPLILKTDYGQEETIFKFGGDPRVYQTTVKEFKKDRKGNLKAIVVVSLESKVDEATGRRMMVPVEGTEREMPCELALIAAGFLGSEQAFVEAFRVEADARTNIKTEVGTHRTSREKVFTAGDAHTGQSLVVKAIADGRGCAREVDEMLMGYSNL